MLNERSLEFFLQVYQTGSIRLAAQKLYVSPQSVSKTILELEEELQEKLFIRERKRLLPTRQAVELKRHAERILEEYRKIRSKSHPETAQTQLKIYCTYGVVEYLGAHFVQEFRRYRPDILLYLIEVPDKQALELLRQKESVLAILSDPSDRNLYDSRYLCSSSYCHVVRRKDPLCSHDRLSIRDLEGANIVGKGDEFQLYINQMAHFPHDGKGPKVVLETTSYHLAMQMAKEGLASAFVPTCLAKQYAPEGTVLIPAKEGEHEKQFYLVTLRNTKPEEAAATFVQFLLDWTEKHPPDAAEG